MSALNIGTSVRIKSKCSSNGRTGVVADETPKNWADMGWHRVVLDPKPPGITAGIFPESEIEIIKASDRGGAPAQASLFGGVS